jgi:hypothetical protein
MWSAKYADSYSMSDADAAAVKWMLGELGWDVSRFDRVVANYLAREDKYLTPNRHPLLTLRSQFNSFKGPTTTGPPAAPVTPGRRGGVYESLPPTMTPTQSRT